VRKDQHTPKGGRLHALRARARVGGGVRGARESRAAPSSRRGVVRYARTRVSGVGVSGATVARGIGTCARGGALREGALRDRGLAAALEPSRVALN
jgi:hypothetical protein